MSTQVVRVEGYNKGSLGTIGRECDRADVNHRNQEIIKELSHLNYSYKEAPQGFKAEYEDIKISLNAQGKETKKGIAFEGMLITADLPFFERLGYKQGKSMSKEVKAFFDRSYEFAKAQIGYQGTDKNILSAKIHLDEKTPHLHLYYVPITDKWQSKVYAKDEQGKVLRTEKGTPIQAKDENGKIIYEQHENKTAHKLSRSEFWRVRGGQSSYRQMQDRFYETVGKKYQLERGEIGSDKKHKRTAVYKAEQLEAAIQPYRELQTSIDEVQNFGKNILPSVVVIKKKDLEVLQEQAKAYTVNRDELSNIRLQQEKIKEQASCLCQRENQLNSREQSLNYKQAVVDTEYQRQININKILEQTEENLEICKSSIASLQEINESLEMGLSESLNEIEDLKKTKRDIYLSLTNIVKACGMLKYDKEDGYAVPNLTEKQKKLIDGIAEYGMKWATEDGYPSLAKDMKEHVGISKSIQKFIKPQKQHHHFYDGPEL